MSLSPPQKKAAASPAPRSRKVPPRQAKLVHQATAVTPGPAVTSAVPAGTQESSSSDEEMLAIKSHSKEVSAHTTPTVCHSDGSTEWWL